MSAIAGMIDWRGAPVGDAVRKMLAALRLHGRDGEGFWDGGDVALGFRQTILHAEDRADRQPLTGGGGRFKLVFDGRIDNREDLACALALPSERARDWPDSAYVLAAFEKWGEDCVPHLLGDFAFAVWDAEERALFLARDHFGKRPLVYFANERFFVFASMPSALLTNVDVPHEIDEDTLIRELTSQSRLTDRTFFRGVFQIAPAHSFCVGSKGMSSKRYWYLENVRDIRFKCDRDYVDSFRECLDTAVSCCLRTIHPIGSHLSSGWDSSSVTATAAIVLARSNQRLSAFTHVPPKNWAPRAEVRGQIDDEGAIATAVAALYPNIDHVLVPGPPAWNFDGLDAWAQYFERPRSDVTNAGWYDSLHHLARERGIRVMLTGMGGNHSISYAGLDVPGSLLRQGKLVALVRELIALRAAGRSIRNISGVTLAPLFTDTVWSWIERSLGRPDARSRAVGIASAEVTASPDWKWKAKSGELGPSNLHRATRRQRMIHRSRTFDFSRIFSGSLAAWDLQHRDPATDRRIVEFCYAIPDDQYFRDGNTKWLMRRAMTGVLPNSLLTESRRGLQGADWPDTALDYRSNFERELDLAQANPVLAKLLNYSHARSLLNDWESLTIRTSMKHFRDYFRMLHAIGVARFVRRLQDGTDEKSPKLSE